MTVPVGCEELARRIARLEKVLADESRAGFSWGRHMVHGDKASIEAVLRMVATHPTQEADK